jgi:hypothetical protein
VQQLHQQIFAMLTIVACIYAIARGGAPERITAIGFLTAFVLTNLFSRSVFVAFSGIEWEIAAVDTALAAVILFVALGSCRFWALAMAAMMIINVFGHLARLLDAGIIAKAYYALVALISYPMVLLLVIGTWRHRMRLRLYGIDYSWVWQLPPAYRLGWHVVPRKEGEKS